MVWCFDHAELSCDTQTVPCTTAAQYTLSLASHYAYLPSARIDRGVCSMAPVYKCTLLLLAATAVSGFVASPLIESGGSRAHNRCHAHFWLRNVPGFCNSQRLLLTVTMMDLCTQQESAHMGLTLNGTSFGLMASGLSVNNLPK